MTLSWVGLAQRVPQVLHDLVMGGISHAGSRQATVSSTLGLPWWLRKKSACSEGDVGLIPGLGSSPGGGTSVSCGLRGGYISIHIINVHWLFRTLGKNVLVSFIAGFYTLCKIITEN